MAHNQQLGRTGELAARHYLEEKGWQFVAANARTRVGEIDLVMRDRDCLVLVEVKTRRSIATGHPAEAVHWHKLRHTVAAAQSYVQTHRHRGPWRVDVVACTGSQIEHISNVTS